MTTNSDSDEDKPNKRIVVKCNNEANFVDQYVDESDSRSSSNITSTEDDQDEDYDDEEDEDDDDDFFTEESNIVSNSNSFHLFNHGSNHCNVKDEAFAANQKVNASIAIEEAKVNNENINNLAASYAKANKISTSSHQNKTNKFENVTLSNDSSERCFSIKKLLQQQYHKYKDSYEAPLEEFWFAADSYNLNAFNEVNGLWPLGHPLPLADWSNDIKPTLKFDSVWQYEDLNALIESKLQHLLEDTHYDTINIFTDFYKAFKNTRRSNLKSFFQFYDIPINRRHHMCVSLAFEIIAQIIEILPELQHYLYVVSCEEQVNQRDYITGLEEVGLQTAHANYMYEKEHVMVALKISIDRRDGIMLLDPGYHVARPVTVMKDQSYPHTGWFTQSKEIHLQRDYCYNFSGYSHKYIEWHEREIRGENVAHKCSVVYIEKPYITAIDVTVRRNLAYNFRSLVSRDAKGNLIAGLYLPVLPNSSEAHFTLFYNGGNDQRIKVKFMLNVFKTLNNIPETVLQHFDKLAPQLKMSKDDLVDVGKSLYDALTDQDFLKQLVSINEDINNIGGLAPDN